jgi:hypothetical protein
MSLLQGFNDEKLVDFDADVLEFRDQVARGVWRRVDVV